MAFLAHFFAQHFYKKNYECANKFAFRMCAATPLLNKFKKKYRRGWFFFFQGGGWAGRGTEATLPRGLGRCPVDPVDKGPRPPFPGGRVFAQWPTEEDPRHTKAWGGDRQRDTQTLQLMENK